ITSDMLLYLTDIIQMVYANSCASSDMIVSLKKFCKAVDTNRRNNRVMMNTMCDWAFEISTFVIDALTTGEMSRLAIEEGEHKWTWLHYGSIIAGNHQFFLSFYKKLIVFLKSHNAYATSLFVLENIIASCTIDPYYPQGSLCALALKTEVGRIKGWFQQVKKSVKNYSFRRLELNESKRSNVVTKSYEKFVKQNISLPYFSLKFVK
ncbi:hypothetical protein J6A31_04990, partial [bacterium]|nr:hypothetical protein [bacterium]